MTNKSEELAKLLEIEPEIEENYCFEGGCSKTHCVCPENCTGCDNYVKEHEVYPDFTKPENFVKLQLLQLRFGALPFLSGYMFTLNTFIDAILYEVKETLLDDRNKFIEEYKQQAQQAEWVY